MDDSGQRCVEVRAGFPDLWPLQHKLHTPLPAARNVLVGVQKPAGGLRTGDDHGHGCRSVERALRPSIKGGRWGTPGPSMRRRYHAQSIRPAALAAATAASRRSIDEQTNRNKSCRSPLPCCPRRQLLGAWCKTRGRAGAGSASSRVRSRSNQTLALAVSSFVASAFTPAWQVEAFREYFARVAIGRMIAFAAPATAAEASAPGISAVSTIIGSRMVSVEHARSVTSSGARDLASATALTGLFRVCEPRARSSTDRPGVFGRDGLAWVLWMRSSALGVGVIASGRQREYGKSAFAWRCPSEKSLTPRSDDGRMRVVIKERTKQRSWRPF